MTRKIIYISGTRADYGLMRAVLRKLDAAADIDLSICVTGMHLSSLYGKTIDEIKADNFTICGIIPVEVDKTTHAVMAQSIAHEILGMVEVFAREKPDLVLLLGDRGEMLAAAISAVHLNIPIAHLHGGERSGTVDEMVRHSISKLSHYHLVSTEASRERLIKMGEYPESVMVVGAPGLDEIYTYQPLSKEAFYQDYHVKADKKLALLIYHPVVQEYDEIQHQFRNVLEAALAHDLQIICLEPNSDAGGQLIREVLDEYRSNAQIRIIKHLQREAYISCLANVDVMLGNSSSGIIEAASFNLTVVNVGSRQNLRECGDNIIHVETGMEAVRAGLKEALARGKKDYKNIYGEGDTSERCYQLLRTLSLAPQILNKSNAY